MPREHKQRGRRGEQKKRKLENGNVDGQQESSKRQRVSDGEENADSFEDQQDYPMLNDGDEAHENGAAERPFFGMLDEEEQDYFKKADEMLELNSFADPNERDLFLANVYREAEGKELKLANSQSCSRLMERLIRLSSAQQLKKLFQKFNGK